MVCEERGGQRTRLSQTRMSIVECVSQGRDPVNWRFTNDDRNVDS